MCELRSSALLNRAAKVWRSENGRPWLCQAPPKLSKLSMKGNQAKPYPLSWNEQEKLIKALPLHLADAALFAVNTGCCELEICQLRWEWELYVKELDVSVFVLPETITKTRTERVVVLNSIASRVVESCRGKSPEFVFTFKGNPMKRMGSVSVHAGGPPPAKKTVEGKRM